MKGSAYRGVLTVAKKSALYPEPEGCLSFKELEENQVLTLRTETRNRLLVRKLYIHPRFFFRSYRQHNTFVSFKGSFIAVQLNWTMHF